MTLKGAVWLWGVTIGLATLGLATLVVLHGRWGVGLLILAGGAGFLLGARWLARVRG